MLAATARPPSGRVGQQSDPGGRRGTLPAPPSKAGLTEMGLHRPVRSELEDLADRTGTLTFLLRDRDPRFTRRPILDWLTSEYQIAA